MGLKDLLYTFLYVFLCGMLVHFVFLIAYYPVVLILFYTGIISGAPDIDTLIYMFEGYFKNGFHYFFFHMGLGLPVFFIFRNYIKKKFKRRR